LSAVATKRGFESQVRRNTYSKSVLKVNTIYKLTVHRDLQTYCNSRTGKCFRTKLLHLLTRTAAVVAVVTTHLKRLTSSRKLTTFFQYNNISKHSWTFFTRAVIYSKKGSEMFTLFVTFCQLPLFSDLFTSHLRLIYPNVNP